MTRFHLAALLGVVGLIAAAVVGMPRARYAAYDNQGALALRALDKSARAPGFAGGIAPEESRDAFRFPSDDNDLEFGPSQGSSNLSDVTPVASGPNNIQRIQQSATDRYLIKNATVTMEATDPRAAATQLSQWVANAGGYISDLNETVDSLDRRTLSMQVRVPSKDFDRLMGQLGTFGKTL
ncbi:MAG TPA: DUF4349 domain-containing protein, partial [bacterium]|nr:DUF4349 domain-containing protein [bacterium]